MSKILFVCNFFNNPNKVSSQRTTHLVNTLKDKDLDVEVLISGEEDSFESSVMTLDEAKTSNTLSFILNYFNYKKKLIELSKKYDLIILSVPRFS
ncbi:glycosyltransferase family 4 protein, partial [Vibrio vulnificus]|nr:glycosyltransferase family 4 protein [Vibrio vulnificus]